ncbi:MAG: MBL fold metallo-hydrolase [Chthoniobacterales bacterium]|jgi:hydroxyacylglutathione hydrolase
MTIPLEDNAGDVISKAQRGLGISDSELAERSGVSPQAVRQARSGEAEATALEKIAPVLQLDPRALTDLANAAYKPDVREIDGLAMFNTRYGDMTVNAYLVWDPQSHAAVAFDTGADCGEMLETMEREHLQVQLILLTHSHPDHIEDLQRLQKATGAPVYISGHESASGAEPIEEGREFSAGALHIRSLLTWGHSRGGMTFFVTGLTTPIAVVGDAIFAGSMGGGNVSYSDAVQTNAEKILTLPDETIICPGHGPLTTVGNEKAHNPFFALSFRA